MLTVILLASGMIQCCGFLGKNDDAKNIIGLPCEFVDLCPLLLRPNPCLLVFLRGFLRVASG